LRRDRRGEQDGYSRSANEGERRKQKRASLQASNTSLQKQLTVVQANPALDLGPYVKVDPDGELDLAGPQITFTGANIHIESGQGSTDDESGLGNLIIGYNEFPNDGGPLGPHQRFGGHNLVIGPGHRYTGDDGLVAGRLNTISGQGATVTSGSGNVASGNFASVSAVPEGSFFSCQSDLDFCNCCDSYNYCGCSV
jgi:hypothetical protein